MMMAMMPGHTRRQGAVIQFNSIRPKHTLHIYVCKYMHKHIHGVLVCACGADMGESSALNVCIYVHALAYCLLCRRYFVHGGCVASTYDERAFSLVAVDSIVGWVCCVFAVLHQIEWFSAYLFGCSVSFLHKPASNNASAYLYAYNFHYRMPQHKTLKHTHRHTHTHSRTHLHMHDHTYKYLSCFVCVRAIDKVNFNFIRSLSLLLVMFGIHFIYTFFCYDLLIGFLLQFS